MHFLTVTLFGLLAVSFGQDYYSTSTVEEIETTEAPATQAKVTTKSDPPTTEEQNVYDYKESCLADFETLEDAEWFLTEHRDHILDSLGGEYTIDHVAHTFGQLITFNQNNNDSDKPAAMPAEIDTTVAKTLENVCWDLLS